MRLKQGQAVRHRQEQQLGIGTVGFVQDAGGQEVVFVSWPTRPGTLVSHPLSDLEPIQELVDRLASVSPTGRRPFILRALGRWFEARHALTGELSNQPFQMLPHQVLVTHKVVNSAKDQRRWLIADDVGLGKTIEAGMIMEVLRKHKPTRFRCLVITPAGLCTQWQEEMKNRFGRAFQTFQPRFPNLLETCDFLIASIDSLKGRRFQEALRGATPWDLILFDEAHHLATETSVQKYQLARFLKDENKGRNTLFLTATPHSGRRKHFYNMIALLRPDLFPSESEVSIGDGRLNQVMIRNRKTEVTDVRGQRIFKGIEKARIIKCKPSPAEEAFYEALLLYVRTGYGVAQTLEREKDRRAEAVGFLMATFAKLASSSRAAIRGALEKRLFALRGGAEGLAAAGAEEDRDDRFIGEDEEARAAKAALEVAPKGKGRLISPIEDEAAAIEKLLQLLGRMGEQDTKQEHFLREMKSLPVDLKVLIFTEYRATQDALVEVLQRAFGANAVTQINGSMALCERRQRVEDFNELRPDPRFLVSTEAGGEGLNMQKSCHVVMNYDLPWNPVRLQQRIGRVYRYGQEKKVQVYNFKLEGESEAFIDRRVEEYLRIKIEEITTSLAQIQDSQPEDLVNDVLGMVVENVSINDLYAQAITRGEEAVKETIDRSSADLRRILADRDSVLGLFRGLSHFDITDYQEAAARVATAELGYFIEQYLWHSGARVTPTPDGLWSFSVPDELRRVAERMVKADSYQVRELPGARVERATADKELAQATRSCRLLRFGDVAFEAMVKHVQESGFSDGVASLRLPAAVLGWSKGEQGLCALFNLQVLSTEGGEARTVRDELAAYLIGRGRPAVPFDRLFEELRGADAGPAKIPMPEVRELFDAARATANARLTELRRKTGEVGITSQLHDFALAWVEAGD